LGIEVKIKIINSLGESFDALLVAQEIPPDPDQYSLWHSTQASNISHYKSPKLDKLLEDGRKTLDKEKRKEIYADFQRFLVEDTPAIFLFHPTLYTVSRD
jgi:peptide/nickel transport system substrate-binding protein